MSKSNILFIFTGSIACYKAVSVVSKLVQAGNDVHCVLTKSASKFIGKTTLEGLTGNNVHGDLFEEGSVMGHIHLLRKADMVVVAPATANFINKIAHGIADDLATTLFLAHDFDKPFVIVPAMNTSMYEHPTTKDSISKLQKLKIHLTSTGSGVLACGEVGYGKMLEPEQILQEIQTLQVQLNSTADAKTAHSLRQKPTNLVDFQGKKILITGGGTVEPLDSVRSITNTSTGSTAVHMAQLLTELGYQVTLLLSQNYQGELDEAFRIKSFLSFADLNQLLKTELSTDQFDFVIHAAAVSDFSVKQITSGNKKIKRATKINSDKELKIILKPNFKLISKIKSYSKNKQVKIIGFKLTDSSSQKKQNEAVSKLFQYPQVEWVVHNDLVMISKDKNKHEFRLIKKNFESVKVLTGVGQLVTELARQLV